MNKETTNWYVCPKCGSNKIQILKSSSKDTICKCREDKCGYQSNDFNIESSK